MEVPVTEAIKEEIRRLVGHGSLSDPQHLEKLEAICDHSTHARHGKVSKKPYGKERLRKFLAKTELERETGWIYRLLRLLQPNGNSP